MRLNVFLYLNYFCKSILYFVIEILLKCILYNTGSFDSVCHLQEGYNNEKLNTHSRLKLDSLAYIVSHSHWFYALRLTADLLLLALAIIEPPSVPIPGFTPSVTVSGVVFYAEA